MEPAPPSEPDVRISRLCRDRHRRDYAGCRTMPGLLPALLGQDEDRPGIVWRMSLPSRREVGMVSG